MKKINDNCNPLLIDHLLDNELEPEKERRVRSHLKHCQRCREIFQSHQAISTFFKTGLEYELAQTDLSTIQKNVLNHLKQNHIPWWKRMRDVPGFKPFLIPAAAMALILVAVFTVYQKPAPESIPSAIVTSLKGDVASVMILETPDTHQTIIWYKETN